LNKKVITSFDNLIPLIQESFQNKQSITFKVKGTSMAPFFIDNQTEATLAPFSGTLSRGTVYLYKVSDTYLLHRYVKTKDGKHYFRGDALYQYEIILKDDIIGEVIQMKLGSKETDMNSVVYQSRVRLFMCTKTMKSIIRRIVKGR
jgi:hypothetical protein